MHAKSLEIRTRIYGDSHALVADSFNNMANIYYEQGKSEEALEMHTKSLEIKTRIYGDSHPSAADSRDNLGLIFETMRKKSEAKSLSAFSCLMERERRREEQAARERNRGRGGERGSLESKRSMCNTTSAYWCRCISCPCLFEEVSKSSLHHPPKNALS
jgi:tetratricopeptide (TPR) repeat protein